MARESLTAGGGCDDIMMGCITHASHTSQGQGQDKDKGKDCADSRCRIPDNANASLCAQSNSTAGNQKTGGGTTACKGKIDQSREVQDQVRQGQVRQQKWPFGSWGGAATGLKGTEPR